MRLSFKIAANTLVQILGKFVSATITLLIIILVAKNFGVEGFGEFVKITTYVSFFYLVSDFGFNAIVLKDIQAIPKKQEEYFSNLLGLRVFFSLFLIFLSLAILSFLPFNPLTYQGFTPFTRLGIIILSGTILTQAIFITSNVIFQKNLRYDKTVFASSFSSLVTLFLVVLVIFTKPRLIFVILSYLLGGVFLSIGSIFLVKPMIKRFFLGFNFSLWKDLFLRALPLGMTLFFNLLYFKIDTLILTVYRTTKEVGIYGLARSFFEFPLSIPTFFMNAVYPIMVQSFSREESRLLKDKTIKYSFLFLISSSLFLVVTLWFISPYLSLIKKEFIASVPPFRILTLTLPLFFLSSLFMWVLIACGKQRVLIPIYGFSMILNIILNLIFIPRFGYLAAALIIGATEGLVLILLLKATLKELK